MKHIDIEQRRKNVLSAIVESYIETAAPIGSRVISQRFRWSMSPATIRNVMADLEEMDLIMHPHTSAGRIPTQKAYRYFAEKISAEREDAFSDFIAHQIRTAHQQIEQEMKLAEELMRSLSEASTTLNYTRIQNNDNLFEILEILGPSKTAHNKNIDIINKIIKELENF